MVKPTQKTEAKPENSLNISMNSPDSHQSTANYVICFMPFKNRDLFYTKDKYKDKAGTALAIKEPIIVVNDAARITISNNKGSPTDSAEVVLMSGDQNYSSSLAPGDHAMIWLMNDKTTFDTVSNKVLGKANGVNTLDSGLKFIGRVVSVRQMLSTDPSTGTQTYRHLVTLGGFTELQTQIYFNELLSPQSDTSGNALSWFVQVSEQYKALFKDLKNNGRMTTESVIRFYLNVFMGDGPKDRAKQVDASLTQTPNASFLIPTQLAKYLNITKKEDKSVGIKYADVLHRIMGIQKYNPQEMFPSNIKKTGTANEFNLDELKGGALTTPGNFNNITLWSLLTNHSNPSLNEIYTTLKYIPSKNGIYPTITLREMPFTSDKIDLKDNTATKYSSLPRWKIDDKYPIMNYNIGTSDAERFNFMQIYSNSISTGDVQKDQQVQVVLGNIGLDDADILRSGPRIHSSTSDVDAKLGEKGWDASGTNLWAKLITDWFINGHLKMNGTMTVAGIQQPICIGDNLQFDNKVFHIEGIVHNFEVAAGSGKKNFTTTLALSHGYYVNGNKLDYMSSQSTVREYQPDKLLPGYSDSELYVNDAFIESQVNSDQLENQMFPDATAINEKVKKVIDEKKALLKAKAQKAINSIGES